MSKAPLGRNDGGRAWAGSQSPSAVKGGRSDHRRVNRD